MLMRACDDPRLLASLRHNCTGPILTALEDPEVIEIMLVSYIYVICIRYSSITH